MKLRLLMVLVALTLAIAASQNSLLRSWQGGGESAEVAACDRPGCVATIQRPSQTVLESIILTRHL